MAAFGGGVPPMQAIAPKAKISIGAINDAGKMVQAQLGAWLVSVFIFLLIGGGVLMVSSFALVAVFPDVFLRGNPALQRTIGVQAVVFVFGLLTSIISYFMIGGMMRMAIRQLRGESLSAGDLFSVSDVAGPLLTAAVLIGTITGVFSAIGNLVGLPAFVTSLISLLIGSLFLFTIPLIVDQRMSAGEAIGKSADVLKSHIPMSFLFLLISCLIAGIGVILCGVGLLFTAPLPLIAIAINYRNFMLAGALPNTMVAPMPYPGGGFAPMQPLNYPGQMPQAYPPQQGYAPPPQPGYGQVPGVVPPGGYQTPPTQPGGATPQPGYAPPPQAGYTPPPVTDLNAPQPQAPAPPPLNGPSNNQNPPPR